MMMLDCNIYIDKNQIDQIVDWQKIIYHWRKIVQIQIWASEMWNSEISFF